MQIMVIVDKSAFDAAIAAAERIGHQNERIRGLEAPIDGALSGWIEEVWEAVRPALDRAYQLGAEAARSAVQAAEQVIDRVMTDAGRRAWEVAAAMRAKITAYVTQLIDEMLKQVRPNLKIGDGTLKLSEVQISQKLIFGGSLTASLEEAVALTSSREFNIDASYRA